MLDEAKAVVSRSDHMVLVVEIPCRLAFNAENRATHICSHSFQLKEELRLPHPNLRCLCYSRADNQVKRAKIYQFVLLKNIRFARLCRESS